MNANQLMKKQEERDQKELVEFQKKLNDLSIEHNFFLQPIIDFDGPHLRFVRMKSEEIEKLRNNNKKVIV